MTPEDFERLPVEEAARYLYTNGQTARPAWDQLGDTTKGVWRGYVESGRYKEWPFPRVRGEASKPEPVTTLQEEPAKISSTPLGITVHKQLTLKERLARKGL